MEVHYAGRERWAAAPLHPGLLSVVARALLGIAGCVAGIVAAVEAYGQAPSLWFAFFAFAMASWAIGVALADVLTLPYPVLRLLYFALVPPLCMGVAVLAYNRWNTDCSAIVAGVLGGGILHVALGWLCFRRVMRTRRAGWNRRVDVYQERWGPFGPYDVVPKWYRDQHGRARERGAVGVP